MPTPRKQPRAEREPPDHPDPLGVDPPRQERAHAKREWDRAQRVARVEHRGMDDHRRKAQQRVEPHAFARRRVCGGERLRIEDHQRDEEAPEAEHDRRCVGRHVADAPAGEEQRKARPQRHQPRPQQQRAFLRRPHRGGLIKGRRRPARCVGDRVEGEVVVQKGELQDHERDRQDPGERIHRAPPGLRELEPPCPHAVDRRANPVHADRECEQQTYASERRHQRLRSLRRGCISACPR